MMPTISQDKLKSINTLYPNFYFLSNATIVDAIYQPL
jgi:hypothetical protein